jgi:hypothetical protein
MSKASAQRLRWIDGAAVGRLASSHGRRPEAGGGGLTLGQRWPPRPKRYAASSYWRAKGGALM